MSTQFNVASAKIVAAAVARCLIGWGIELAIQYHIVTAAWASDPKHITTLTIICIAAVYELEDLAFKKWDIDIPGIVSRIVSYSKPDDPTPTDGKVV